MENKPFIEIDAEHLFFSPFEIKPVEGYAEPENFPQCCNFHKSIYKGLEDFLEKFPNCCEPHKKLLKKSWFNKAVYANLPLKIIKQISYTEQLIEKQINSDGWYKDITDYLDYNVQGLGHPAIGLDIYLQNIKLHLQTDSWIKKRKISIERSNILIEFIEGYYKEFDSSTPDLNVLYEIYQKWLKIFPFNISYFTNLKERFNKQIPILTGKIEVNKYSHIAKSKIHTKSSMIESLTNLTNELLTQINGLVLYEKGQLSDTNRIKLELCVESRKLKIKTGYRNNSSTEEQRYRKIIKEWFKDEKEFINEITLLLSVSDKKKDKEPKAEASKEQIIVDYNTQIFKSPRAFQLFESWHKEMFSKNKHLADYSYVIRQMLVDKLVYDTTQKVLIDFLATYDIHLTKIKTLSDSKTTTKRSLYLKLKEHHI